MDIRKKIKKILKEEFDALQRKKLVEIMNALEFKNEIIAAGGEIYAVGGIVRDAIMGTPSDDLDIVVRGVAYENLFRILSRYGVPTDTSKNKEDKDFGSTKFVSSNEEFNNYLAVNGVDKVIDVMLPRKDAKDPNVKGHKGITSDVNPAYTIDDDLQRRDITINAIAMDMDGNIITSGTGLEDIQNGIIRAVSEDSFIEDPLRMLRAVRFAARYNYDWDPATINLIKKNVNLLADKAELPTERFLGEFKKMIGKADLSRAVQLMVELGMYKAIFGIESKIDDYVKFQDASSVGEMAYMMFDNESPNSIIKLIENNITNDAVNLAHAGAILNYVENIKTKNLDYINRVNFLAEIFRKGMNDKTKVGPGSEMLLNSSYIEPQDKEIAKKFSTGELPIGAHDVAIKGQEFADFMRDLIIKIDGAFIKNRDGRRLGAAKQLVVEALYSGKIKNDIESIKKFLIDNSKQWML